MVASAGVLPIVTGMTIRHAQRTVRRHRAEWWVLTAWGSLAMLVLVGVVAAASGG
jgi:hypothetical protein